MTRSIDGFLGVASVDTFHHIVALMGVVAMTLRLLKGV